ncbi:MAG: plasmid mobilization protein [Thermoplasmataceae archaeon]|jgi:hypothetical protein
MSENKTRVLIYLRTEEKELVTELATKYGLSLSRYLILSALGKLKPDRRGEA